MNESTVLTVFTDFVCPWCYLSTPRIDRLREEYPLRLEWVCFPLHPDTPPEGLSLETLFAGRGYDLDEMHRAMQDRMDAEGLPYRKRTHTYNTRLAQELARWAESEPGGDAIHDVLYRAYFVNGQNLADPEILEGIAGEVGLDVAAARAVIAERRFRNEIDRDWTIAREAGISGVPSFAAGRYRVAGAQPYEVLERLVVEAGAVRRRPSSDA